MSSYEQTLNEIAMWDVDISEDPSDQLVFALNGIRVGVGQLLGIKTKTVFRNGCYVVERVENETNRHLRESRTT